MVNAQVIVAGTDLWHDLLAGGQAIQNTLLEAGIHTTLRVGLERFNAEQEKTPDVYVINAMATRISPEGTAALAAKVAAGTGLVVLHATNVAHGDWKEQTGFFQLIGSRFVKHPPLARFTVKSGEAHPITDGVKEFEIEDEGYEIEWTGEAPKVLATGEWGGAAHPIVYVHEYRKGRVCYIALGHDGRAWSNPGFKKLIVQSTAWAAAK